MDANIRSIVEELKKVPLEQVVFEAITNSIQANARQIKVYFYTQSSILEDGYQSVQEIKIIDDGEGFNESNLKSFDTYRSDHKKNLGAKGVGRFLYLKLFDQVDIYSLSHTIKFTVNDKVQVMESLTRYPETTLHLLKPKAAYLLDKQDFPNKVKNHFLPYFKLLTSQDKAVGITVYFNGVELQRIDSKDIPDFQSDSFEIHAHQFNLSYLLNDGNITASEGFYCAANRVVSKHKGVNGVKILFLLSSAYFDQNINDERNEFTIKRKQTSQDLFGNLSWVDIEEALALKIRAVCLQQGIDVVQEARKNLQQSIDTAPFLAHYLDKNDSVLSSDELIKNAKKTYESEKCFLRNPKNKTDKLYPVVMNRVVQTELAEYIFDREKLIDKLKSITDDALMEKEIHRLFMPQYSASDNAKNYKSNNLWLFDDRFMTYDKIFSEAQIKEIFPDLASAKRIDVLSIISNTYNKECITDIVIIELKRPEGGITPAGAEEQLLEYARHVNSAKQENKIRIWAYAFLKFNSEVEEKLNDKSYNKIPTQSRYPIYYRYYERPNMIINFMDYTALADDANTRNQTFINILKGVTFDA